MIDLVDRTLKAWRQSSFVFGQSDCLLSVGDYIAAAGGLDVANRFRGTYDDEAGALALLAAHGGHAGLIGMTGLPEIDPSAACRGDVLVIDTGSDRIAALCTGQGVAGRAPKSVFEVSRRFVVILNAWKV